MALISVPSGGEWRQRFRALEMRIFGISPEDWPTAFFKTIKVITNEHYPADKHALHIALLNQTFGLVPALNPGDFGASATLQDVQDDQVAPRLPFTGATRQVDVDFTAQQLHDLRLSHLVEGE